MLSAVPGRREMLAWLLVVALLMTQVVTFNSRQADAGPPTPTTRVVYIATGENFPDALAAAAAAAVGLGPVLLVQQNALPAATKAELERLEPRDIVIVGGLAVISQAVEDELNALAYLPTVTRISGANRYITAAELSEAIHPTSGVYPRVAFDDLDDITDGNAGVAVTILAVAINAPDKGFLVIDAGADMARDSADTVISCWVVLDGDTVGIDGSLRLAGVSTNNPEEDCSTQVAVPVGEGDHTVTFWVDQDADTLIRAGALVVQWIPFGNFGQLPTTAP